MRIGSQVLALSAIAAGAQAAIVVPLGYLSPLLGGVLCIAMAAVGAGVGRGLAERLEPMVARAVEAGMGRESPYEVAEELAEGLVAGVLAALGFIAGSLGGLMAFGVGSPPPIYLAVAPAPIIPGALRYLKLVNAASERKSLMEVEWPFFSVLAAIVSHCGGTLYMAFKQVARAPEVFKQMSKEAREVERKAILGGMGIMRAMEVHASTNPSDEFQSGVLTATSVWRTGGDVTTTLESISSDALRSMGLRFERFASTVGTLAESSFILLMLFPMGVAVAAIASPQMMRTLTIVFGGLVVPITAMLLYLVVRATAPRKDDIFEPDPRRLATSIAAGASVAAALTVASILGGFMGFKIPLPVAVSASAGIALLSVYMAMRGQVREVEDTERELKRFTRVVAEFRRLGLTLTESVKRAAQQRYRPGFKKLVKGISTRIRMGMGIWQASAMARSWLGRMIFYMIDRIDRLGGGSPALLEKVIGLLSAYSASRDVAKSRVKLYLWLTYAMPFIVALIFGMILPMIGGVSAGLPELSRPGFMGGTPRPPQLFQPAPSPMVRDALDMTFAVMVIASIAQALTISRAIDLHFWGLHRAAIAALLYIPAYYLIDPLSGFVSEALMTRLAGVGGAGIG